MLHGTAHYWCQAAPLPLRGRPSLFPLSSLCLICCPSHPEDNSEQWMCCLLGVIFPPADESAISIFSSLWLWWARPPECHNASALLKGSPGISSMHKTQISICHFWSLRAVIQQLGLCRHVCSNYWWPLSSPWILLASFASLPQPFILQATHFPLWMVSKSVICNFAAD